MGRMRCATHANERQTIILDGFRLLLLLLLRCQRSAGAGGAIIGHQEEGITCTLIDASPPTAGPMARCRRLCSNE